MRSFWYHPESGAFWATDGEPFGDGLQVELTRDEYHAGMLKMFHEVPGPKRVVVFGGRDFSDQKHLDETLDAFHSDVGFYCLIEGEAPGADTRAKLWAKRRGIPVEPYPARWGDLTQPDSRIMTRANGTKYDAAEGGRRNQRMIDEGKPDCGIAFAGRAGTADMKNRCELAGIPVFEV